MLFWSSSRSAAAIREPAFASPPLAAVTASKPASGNDPGNSSRIVGASPATSNRALLSADRSAAEFVVANVMD